MTVRRIAFVVAGAVVGAFGYAMYGVMGWWAAPVAFGTGLIVGTIVDEATS